MQFPIRLRSKGTGVIYEFTGPTTAIVVSIPFKYGGTRRPGDRCVDLICYKAPDWWEPVDIELKYDPTQEGDTEDDI